MVSETSWYLQYDNPLMKSRNSENEGVLPLMKSRNSEKEGVLFYRQDDLNRFKVHLTELCVWLHVIRRRRWQSIPVRSC